MRIVLDLQACQSENRLRGMGRYSLALAKEMAQQASNHEVWIALSSQFPDTVEELRVAFDGLVPQNRIVTWSAPGPVAGHAPENRPRRQAAECLREAFLASLNPDIVHVASLFEGYTDDAVTSIGAFDCTQPNAVTLYDLIPLVLQDLYLSQPPYREWYFNKIEQLKRARLWLAISENSRKDAINLLGFPERRVVNISTAADAIFKPTKLSREQEAALRTRYGINRPFIMCTGGIDHRKNIEGLIAAFAKLPRKVRSAHQLVIVCKTSSSDCKRLEAAACKAGLAQGELVLTGFVSDEEMVALYNLTRLFVFPSWHEGLGLSVLEAMSCGAAVIGSDATSLPEVIGREDALFDARNEESIAAKMQQVLSDSNFQADLCRHSGIQSRRFSRSESARRALAAFEEMHAENRQSSAETSPVGVALKKPRLAFVSPLPPERSGIADYSAELLPELARHYEIEAIVDQAEVADPWIKANIKIRNSAWFEANANGYERVIYHFGNSTFHRHMFELLERHPGVVVLHDFFLSGVLAHLEIVGQNPGIWTQALYNSHGYRALLDRSRAARQTDINRNHPCNREILEQATGVIVHSEFSRRLAAQFFGPEIAQKMIRVPFLRQLQEGSGRDAARARLGFQEDDFIVCSFGLLNSHKLNDRLLAAWLASPLAGDKHCRLVFVGENDASAYGANFAKSIEESASKARISITGFADPALYRSYLAAADLGVQLRTLSRGETSAAIMDCLSFGLPVVVNAHGTSAELADETVEKLPDLFTDEELSAALVKLRNDPARRERLARKATAHLRSHHDSTEIAKRYFEAIELFDQTSSHLAQRRLAHALVQIDLPAGGNEHPFVDLAVAMAKNQAQTQGMRHQLLVDITAIVNTDLKTGIQRVVRSVLWELLKTPPAGIHVEPVYCTGEDGYRYARKFMSTLLGCDADHWQDDPIETRPDDCLLGLDFDPSLISHHRSLFCDLRNRGVRIFFVVYDLLPILRPDCFPKTAARPFQSWIETVTSVSEGLMCISRSVADELLTWLKGVDLGSRRPLKVGYFHLGADIAASLPTHGIEKGFEEALARMSKAPVFLMVGTVEPRKGHAQTLAAFEQLWARKVKARLVIVGTCGWMVEALSKRLRKHEQLGENLFWFEKATDEMLVQLYEQASAMVIASEAEGFGLPLIEAAQHKLPIIARDIPVFREIAGEHALYFSGTAPDDLARAIQRWLALFNKGEAPSAENMPWQTWTDTADQIKEMLLCGDWYQQKDGALADGLPDYAGTRKQTAFVTA